MEKTEFFLSLVPESGQLSRKEKPMKKPGIFLRLLPAVLAVVLLAPGTAPAAAVPDFVALAKELKPAVVNISTSKLVKPKRPTLPGPQSPNNDFFDEFFNRFFQGQPNVPRKERSLGSGFLISREGYILTNEHVVDGADEIKVRLDDGRSFTAAVKGQDSKLDIALLKIDAGGELPAARLGDSEALEVGEWVMAIGNPFGLSETVTVGIVSAKGRVIGAGPYDNFIQTDASINPGNSGGPLFNSQGLVVGINSAIVSGGQGIGFAIPINAVKDILPQLKETGHVVRGWLGVTIQPMTPQLAESFGLKEAKGALVSEVIKDSPAARAGLRRGDIIVSLDGKEVDNIGDLPRLVAAIPVGEKIKIGLHRDGKSMEVTAKVGKLAETEEETSTAEGASAGTLGLTVVDVTPDAARAYGLASEKGALVTAIDPSGPAADSDLRPGDLIIEVDGSQIDQVKDFAEIAGKAKKGQVLRLLVQRGESVFYTTIQME
jgi:serine protease Do